MWGRAVLSLCAVVLAVGAFLDDGRPGFGLLWAFLAVANGWLAVRRWRALRGAGDIRAPGP
jgi:hypothetical protein